MLPRLAGSMVSAFNAEVFSSAEEAQLHAFLGDEVIIGKLT